MDNNSGFHTFRSGSLAGIAAQILGALLVITGLATIWAALFNSLTPRAIGTAVFWLGMLVLVFGIFSMGGTRATARSFSAQFAQTLDADTPGDRARRAGAEMVLQFAWPLRLILAGGLAMVIGTLLGA